VPADAPFLNERLARVAVQASFSHRRTSSLQEAMSRTYKIALILKSRSSLPIYRDLAKLSDRELDEQVMALIRRMRTNESATIARMVQRNPTFSLN
jgi:hypothetical protein